ncbi:hypothetical protein DPEC_G00073260 [Dallia pectoralis]|uniref:Uncharacterized protein n=1 Tax=Dallia pectoralis TaxID=75939 RepID=A0ACC2H3K0_DALPE|nr:hypothetical protein DPEC_G00073260 [Dallia pectoralis]
MEKGARPQQHRKEKLKKPQQLPMEESALQILPCPTVRSGCRSLACSEAVCHSQPTLLTGALPSATSRATSAPTSRLTLGAEPPQVPALPADTGPEPPTTLML